MPKKIQRGFRYFGLGLSYGIFSMDSWLDEQVDGLTDDMPFIYMCRQVAEQLSVHPLVR